MGETTRTTYNVEKWESFARLWMESSNPLPSPEAAVEVLNRIKAQGTTAFTAFRIIRETVTTTREVVG